MFPPSRQDTPYSVYINYAIVSFTLKEQCREILEHCLFPPLNLTWSPKKEFYDSALYGTLQKSANLPMFLRHCWQ